MSKIDNLKLRDVEVLSDSQLRSSSSGSSSYDSGGNYGSSGGNYGSSGNNAGSSDGSGGGFGFTPEQCMSQETYYEMLEKNIAVSGVYVCGMGWAISEVPSTGSRTGGSFYWPDDFGSFGSRGSYWPFGSSSGSRHTSGGGGGGGGLPNPITPSDTVKVELPTKLQPLFRENGNLNREQMDRLVKLFEEMLEDCGYATIQEYLTSQDFKFSKVMMVEGLLYPIGMSVISNILRIGEIETITSQSISHEMIHLFQKQMDLYESDNILILEFERALITDILYYERYAVNGKIPQDVFEETMYSYSLISNGADSKSDTKYREWLVNITKDGIPSSVLPIDLEWIFDIYKEFGPYKNIKPTGREKNYNYAVLKKSLEIVGAKCKKGNKM